MAQPLNRQAGHALQLKPPAAQPKSSVSAQSVKRPVAPPVYRPQQLPRVLQTKSSSVQSTQAGQAPRRPVAPPVYRPEAKKLVQPKAISRPGQSPTAPPVCRSEQQRIAQPKMASAGQWPTPPEAPPVYRPQARSAIAQSSGAGSGRNPVIEAASSRVRPGSPPTRLPIQMKSAADSAWRSSTPRNAGTTAPVQANHSRRGAAEAQNARGSRNPQKSSVVQRARDMLPYSLNYVLVPNTSMDTYKQHVQMRTRHFFNVVLNAVLEMQRQKGTVKPGMFTDHAKAQEAKGYRLGSEPESKLDAAHLMNTTLIPGSFPTKTERVEQLYRSSAATTTQFQKANVGPDKLIDSQQTRTKTAMLSAIQGGAVADEKFIAFYVTDYLKALSQALTVELPEPEGVLSQARAAAMRAVVEDLENLDGVVKDIASELK
jgi:hypothetical protein